MSDGAHLGVKADRALETILGGKEEPPSDERMSREQMRASIMKEADPMSDTPPSDYGSAAACIAKAMVLCIEEDSGLLAKGADLYEAVGKRWPGFDNWLGGATGFMVGWATNCARWLYEQPPVPNPAIVTVGGDE